jgi:hypothetical protein
MVAIESRGRRKTYFFPVAPNRTATGTNVPKSQPSTGGKGEDETNVSKSRPFPGGKGGDGTAAEPARHKPDLVMKPDKRTQFFNLPVFYEDPWTDYEKGIEIFPKRHTSLCRHRRNREDLVHIQQLKACTATESLINAVGRYSHPSFLRLLCCYHYDQSTFLVWEPVELSLAQVIGSKYSIREAELTSIVWPVSYKVRFLPLEYERRAHIHTPDHPGYSVPPRLKPSPRLSHIRYYFSDQFWGCEDWYVLLRLLMLGLTESL